MTSLFEGSPAYRAGIRRGDIIARVGAEEAKDWTTQDVVDRVKGPKGTTRGHRDAAAGRRGAHRPDRRARRDPDPERANRVHDRRPGTGYIRLQDFSETTNTELGDGLTKLRAAGMQRLMLDLRDNPGGPLDQAISSPAGF